MTTIFEGEIRSRGDWLNSDRVAEPVALASPPAVTTWEKVHRFSVIPPGLDEKYWRHARGAQGNSGVSPSRLVSTWTTGPFLARSPSPRSCVGPRCPWIRFGPASLVTWHD